MTDEKLEFKVKGLVNEFVSDNGPSFNFLRGDYKSKEEREAGEKQQLERAINSSNIGLNKKQ